MPLLKKNQKSVVQNRPETVSPEAFDSWIDRRRLEDGEFEQLFAQLGPRLHHEPGAHWDGEDHFAPLPVVVDRPVRLHVRLEYLGETGVLQAVRFALAPIDADGAAHAWLPILDVGPEQAEQWVVSRRFGAWSRDSGRRLGYQGWWQHRPSIGKADLSTTLQAHSRHARGNLLRIGSRTGHDASGGLHKDVVALVIEADD